MTFLEAVKSGNWIRRKGSTKVICVSENPTNLYNMVRSDFLATDWESAIEPRVEQDDSKARFSLLELD